MTSARRLSRRGFLVGTGLAVLGAGGGIAAGLLVDRSAKQVAPPNPATLRAAVLAEEQLLAAIDDAHGIPAQLSRALRADHEAHHAALVAAVAVIVGSASPSAPAPSPRPSAVSSAAQLRALESAAATAAAGRALALTGRDAALLASISACEATHAELLAGPPEAAPN